MTSSAAYQRVWRASHPEKAREYARKWRERYPDRVKEAHKRSRVKRRAARGFADDRGYPKPTRPVPPLCECCGAPSSRALALDHCHLTGEFRGWLCSKCNTGIGLLGDSLAGVQRAAAYLQRG